MVALTPFSRKDATKYRSDLISWLQDLHFEYSITLATNFAPFDENTMGQLIKKWDARLNRFLLQANWAKRPNVRNFFVAFLEKADVTPHWHVLLRLQIDPASATPEERFRIEKFVEVAAEIWMDLVHSGTADVQKVYSSDVIRYLTKEIFDQKGMDRFIISTEFQS